LTFSARRPEEMTVIKKSAPVADEPSQDCIQCPLDYPGP
jgi:hypothetical protein